MVYLGFQWGPVVRVEVEGVSGVLIEPRQTSVEEGWSSSSNYVYYRKKE
jgi:hypothetical protein